MTTVKHLFISLLVLFGYTAGAWAIEQDSDGYYLIGSVQDWKDFATVVATTNNANAKMIGDVDLGDDQTHIGSVAQNGTTYTGTFDGQGYTLTVAYVGGSRQIVAPFTNVQGATIKNLHVDGRRESHHVEIQMARKRETVEEHHGTDVDIESRTRNQCGDFIAVYPARPREYSIGYDIATRCTLV